MPPDPSGATASTDSMSRAAISSIPTVLSCTACEVTWRDLPDAPCWFCGESGHVANPERLVLD